MTQEVLNAYLGMILIETQKKNIMPFYPKIKNASLTGVYR